MIIFAPCAFLLLWALIVSYLYGSYYRTVERRLDELVKKKP